MKLFSTRLGAMIILGGMMMATSAQAAYLIPIASNFENINHNIKLLLESEITRWKQEALKYKEMLYTDLMGKIGGASLGISKVIDEMKEAAKDAASSITSTTPTLKKVSNLSSYKGSTKQSLENNYIIQAKKGLEYSEMKIAEIQENQRIAIDELARAGIAEAAVEIVGASIDASNSEPKKRAGEISKAKDMNAMYELALGMDRRNYERSLRISTVEATNAGIQAMQTLQGISKVAAGRQKKGQ